MTGATEFQWLLIEPLDVLLFRDGRPFTAGESHRARSLFPPLPTTLQGAIRGRMRADHPRTDFDGWFPNGSYGPFRMRGPFIRCGAPGLGGSGSTALPAPRDLLLSGRPGGACQGVPLAPWKGLPDGLRIGWPRPFDGSELRPLVATGEAEGSAQGCWIEVQWLRQYLQGGHTSVNLIEASPTTAHPRVGIQLDESRQAAEGMLFVVELLRMRPETRLVVGLGWEDGEDGPLPLEPPLPLLRLGGEARTATFEPAPSREGEALTELLRGPPEEVVGRIGDCGRFKLYLSAPAVFATNGWFPDCVDPGTGKLRTDDGVTATMVSGVVGKPVPISGWDLEKRRPRPPQFAVPAGSVYHFELEEPSTDVAERVVQHFHGKCLSAHDPEIGFGLTLVGAWNPHPNESFTSGGDR